MGVEEKSITQESYDKLGGRIYDIRYKAEQEAKMRAILDHVRPCSHNIVLDDGCGTGLLLQKIEAYKVGLDISRELLSAARSRVGKEAKSNLVQADADLLPFRSSIFHTIFAITLIQNLPVPNQSLREIKLVSRPDSLIAISALKKSFSITHFKEVLENSGLCIEKLILVDELKDWLAITTM